MTTVTVPTELEVRHLLARGSGANVAATSPSEADVRLTPHSLPHPLDEAAARVVAAVEAMPRWRVAGRRGRVIAATRRTRVLRFVDDVLILLEPAAGGTLVLVRSASRVGRRDFGQNRRNIAELWRALGVG